MMKTKNKGKPESATRTVAKKSRPRRRIGKPLLFALFLILFAFLFVRTETCLQRKVQTYIASGQRLNTIHISNVNGTLRREDILRLLQLPPRSSLIGIDVRRCRRLLLRCPQIASAQIERIHPHDLFIRVVERIPQFRLVPTEAYPTPVVAADGVIFPGIGLSPDAFQKLPLLRQWESKEKILSFVPDLCHVLQEINGLNADLVPTWSSFTVTADDFVPPGKLECFEVQSSTVQHLRLRIHGLAQQLDELAFILDGARRRRQLPLSRVDLTIAGRAFIKPLTHPLNGVRSMGD
jgi:cell division septal protein FtsQ